MKTSNQKYRRSHWWKFTDWEKVFWIVFLAVIIGAGLYGMIYVIVQSEKQYAAASDSIKEADSVVTTLEEFHKNCDSTIALQNQSDAVMDSVQTKSEEKTKSDDAVFDSTIAGTRVVIKTNRPIRVVVK